jgi:hypothetical protein
MFLRLVIASLVLLCAQLTASPGYAANTYYVDHNGSGTACSNTAPCLDFSAALSASTNAGDTIVCLSPPAPRSITIDKSITIDCSSARASFAGGGSVTASDGSLVRILINIPVSAVDDPLRTVRLRGLFIDGSGCCTSGRVYDRGIDIQAAAVVYIEDSVISNFTKQGIYDHRTGGQTKLFVKDTIISGNAGPGIVAASAAVGVTVLDNVTSENSVYGIAVASGNNVMIRNSVFSGNSQAGVEADPGAQVAVDGSLVSNNNIGVSSSASVRTSNNDINFNNTAISGVTGTFGNNRFSGNVSLGTTPTALGAATSDLGQR